MSELTPPTVIGSAPLETGCVVTTVVPSTVAALASETCRGPVAHRPHIPQRLLKLVAGRPVMGRRCLELGAAIARRSDDAEIERAPSVVILVHARLVSELSGKSQREL